MNDADYERPKHNKPETKEWLQALYNFYRTIYGTAREVALGGVSGARWRVMLINSPLSREAALKLPSTTITLLLVE